MTTYGSRMTSTSSKWCKAICRCLCLAVMMALLSPMTGLCSPERFVDSNEYKDKDFHKGNIKDYSDMVKGDDIDWVSSNAAKYLSQFKVRLGKVGNKSDTHSKALVEAVKATFKSAFEDLESNGSKGTVTADLCIFETQDYSPGKAWIPFVGGHQMQAGIGIEVILVDANNRTVAKFRHFARRGVAIETAAEEAAGDLRKYISKH